RAHARVLADLAGAESLPLHFARGDDALAHGRTRFTGRALAQLIIRNGWRFDMKIDPVENWSPIGVIPKPRNCGAKWRAPKAQCMGSVGTAPKAQIMGSAGSNPVEPLATTSKELLSEPRL